MGSGCNAVSTPVLTLLKTPVLSDTVSFLKRSFSELRNEVSYSHNHVVQDGFVTSRTLQEVVHATLQSPVASVPPTRPVVERFPEQTHPGLMQPAAVFR
jgi:hypothetical protein